MPVPPADQEDSDAPVDPRDREIVELRARLAAAADQLGQARRTEETLNQRLLLSTARATEMEQHLHRRIMEVIDLKNRMARMEAGKDRKEARPNPTARRFSPLLAARTTLRLHRSDN